MWLPANIENSNLGKWSFISIKQHTNVQYLYCKSATFTCRRCYAAVSGSRPLTHLRWEFLLLLTWPRPEQPGVGHFKTFSYMARTLTDRKRWERQRGLGGDRKVTGRSAKTVRHAQITAARLTTRQKFHKMSTNTTTKYSVLLQKPHYGRIMYQQQEVKHILLANTVMKTVL